MTKVQMLIAGLVMLGLFAVSLSCAPCRAALLGAAADCGPSLIAEVAGILVKDSWREDLSSRAASVGIGAVSCALRAVLKRLGAESPGAAGPGPAPAPGVRDSARDAAWKRGLLQRQRARDWLAGHRDGSPFAAVVHPSHKVTTSGPCSICLAARTGEFGPARLIQSCRGRCDDRA